ncbi:MAG: type II toxin-antitoxin system Phd/YefM family antitoxin [Limisphaerales bacterium]
MVVNIHDAKMRLSQLDDPAEEGECISIARAGKASALCLEVDVQHPTACSLVPTT